jgi:tRNA(fMet)-specific endonuclease VapC
MTSHDLRPGYQPFRFSFERPFPKTSGRLFQPPPSELKVPEIVRAELLYAARKSSAPEENRRKVEALLDPLELLPFGGASCQHYAEIRHALATADAPIGPHNLLIAATALAHQAVLVTENLRGFSEVPGLRVLSWE